MSKSTKQNNIFVVKCMSGDYNASSIEEKFRCATWGYYFDRKDAENVIENNITDISELGYYKYAVLISVPPGPTAIGEELQWYEFKWNFETRPRIHDGVWIPEFVEATKTERPREYHMLRFCSLG